MAENEYKYKITVKEDGTLAFQKLKEGGEKFNETAHKVKESASGMGESFKRLQETVLATVGVFEAIHFVGESHEYYLGLKRANAEIQASLESTKGIAGETNEALEQSSDKLFHHTEFAKDNIKNMQAVLLTFPAITKETFDSAQQAIADTAAKLQGKGADLKQVTIQIAKALQDPATGMTMLRREGVNFTKDQIAMVEQMVKTGHAADAQKYIIAELEREFGGSAQAALDAGGASEQMDKTTEDLKETIGQLVDEIEADFMPTVINVIDGFKGMVQWGEKHKGMIEGAIKIVGGLVAIYLVWQTTVKATAAYNTLAALANAALGTSLKTTTVATEEATASMEALDAAMDDNPIGLMVTAVAALAAGFWALADAEDNARKKKLEFEEHASDPLSNTFLSSKAGERAILIKKNIADMRKDYADIASAQRDIAADKNKANEDGLAEATRRLDRAKDNLAVDTALGDKYLKMTDATQTKATKSTSSAPQVTAKTKSTTDTKGEHQIINTWNIKEFGKMILNAATAEEGIKNLGAQFQDLLMQMVMNSQIASGQ